MNIDLEKLPTPCYLVEEELLRKNLEILKSVRERTGCKILLAQKCFSMFSVYPLLSEYLDGTTASGLFEARLGREEFKGEVHVFSPAYKNNDFIQLLDLCDHIVFNSFSQWEKYKGLVKENKRRVSCGLRINPEYSEQEHGIYDPCAEGSRLGVTRESFKPELLDGLDGLHFHTLCEQDSDALEHTLTAVEEKFGEFLGGMKWLNFGGGHHITRPDYDIERLIRCIDRIQQKYGVQVYLEPGEAVALNAGWLVSEVMDFVHNGGITNAIMDTSAACHMPDVIEMPYRPNIIGAGEPEDYKYRYRLGGPTCLAGDIIGDYSFPEPLKIGSRLVFCDMAIYSMVKNNTFNGMPLPAILLRKEDGSIKTVREFSYEDFKNRLS